MNTSKYRYKIPNKYNNSLEYKINIKIIGTEWYMMKS